MPDSAISRKSFSGELAGVLRRSERRHAGVVGHHVTRVVCEPPWGGVFPRRLPPDPILDKDSAVDGGAEAVRHSFLVARGRACLLRSLQVENLGWV